MTDVVNIATILVDDTAGISSLVDLACQASTSPPSIFIDLEGTNLCREGTIAIFTILIYRRLSREHTVYLVDISSLRSLAFSTPGKDGTTLKDILESPTIPKVFFDVRNDSDALFFHYKIALQGIEDVQLMENASRVFPMSKKFVNGLTRCVRMHAGLSLQATNAWERAKETGERLFRPDKGGSYAVFDQRPLSDEIKSYCAADVRYLPALRDLYWGRLSTEKRSEVRQKTKGRVLESQSPYYKPHGRHKALAPAWGF